MTTPTTITTCQVCRRPFERLGRYDHLCPECSPNAAVRLPSCPRCGEVLRVARTGQRVCRSCGEYYTQWNFPAVHSSENNTGPDGSAVAPKLIDTNRIKTASTYSASPGTNPTEQPQPRPCSCVSTDHNEQPPQAGNPAPTKQGRGRASISHEE